MNNKDSQKSIFYKQVYLPLTRKKLGEVNSELWRLHGIWGPGCSGDCTWPLTHGWSQLCHVYISSQLCLQWFQLDSLKSAMVGIFTPWKWKNVINQGSLLPSSHMKMVAGATLSSPHSSSRKEKGEWRKLIHPFKREVSSTLHRLSILSFIFTYISTSTSTWS